MLAKINDHTYIDLSDIYLVDKDGKDLRVFIRPHPKYPIYITDPSDIKSLLLQLDIYQQEVIRRGTEQPQDVTPTSQITMEQLNAAAEITDERDAGQAQSW